MRNDWRPVRGPDRTPYQQSLAFDRHDYAHYEVHHLMLGVILEVFPSDVEHNRSAQQTQDRRGFLHECSVLVVNANSASQLLLDHVIITPDSVSGLDNYYENLPRGSSNLTSGGEYDNALAGIDPYDLDGDWCIVGFIGSSLDQPFIVRWWPHPRNTFDPQTTGAGGLDSQGNAKALNQSGRYFQRVNGVEYTVTKEGNIYVSTRYTNANLTFQQDQETSQGRWPRDVNEDDGGSIQVQVKPSQTLELAWDPVLDSTGICGSLEDQLPQPNPRPSGQNPTERENTYIRVDKQHVYASVPGNISSKSDKVQVETKTEFKVDSENKVSISASNDATIESPAVKLGENATDALLKGTSFNAQLNIFLTAVQTFCTTVSSVQPSLSAACSALQTAATTFQLQLDSLLSTKVKTE